ncbi:PAS domain S-box-containing protein/diguanylate cyclase (GGDEF) domain-containing protein [Paucidesulfovibrio gracilis DSM 16080]|uniref:PAS domain S-box-containing protein/diguanylate cyclase (GGDEF) domain-containing protein n=1 Tax=Paucidesulfovibrio gracilis DSM 16080 TaxID=1121449 RepID=A0A1T4XYQ4_9BACT|nr:PAS domain S-box protein [Paucidesulfovibrio gracilis]SKA94692.1 PAS domain S-box-containing protein/diguanylate cyclase (GGDEF) domain-containing protein [Paucidesulfovibrio gracilis DSM 16080]
MRTFDSPLLDFLRRFVPLTLGLLVVGGLFLSFQLDRRERELRTEAETFLATERQILLETLTDTIHDVRFLALLFEKDLPDMRSPAPGSAQGVFRLAAFMRTKPNFFQLCFITAQGQEQFRLERVGQRLLRVPNSQLQDQSDQPYYQLSRNLHAHQVYVSEFDLNAPHGEVERPFRPTLRVAAPIVYASGQRHLVVLSIDGTRLLQRLRTIRRDSPVRLYLTTAQGHWILGPHSRLEWGHSLASRREFTFAARFPEAANVPLTSSGMTVRTENGLFCMQRLDPGLAFGNEDMIAEPGWRLVAYVPQAALAPPWIPQFLALGLAVLLFHAGLCRYVSKSALRRRILERHIQDYKEKVQAISHSSHDALVMVDERGRVVFWNTAARNILGYASEEALQAHSAAFLQPDPPSDVADVPALKAGPYNTHNGTRPVYLTRRDGSRFPAEVAVSSFRLHGSWWTVNAVRDITRRMDALQELARSREMLVEALSISRMGGFSYSVREDSMAWTPEMHTLHGVDQRFVPTVESMAEFVEPLFRPHFHEAMTEARKGNPAECDLSLRTGHSRRVWVRAVFRAHFSGDSVIRISGVYQDVTDRRLERQHLEQLSTAVEHTPVSVVITDPNLRVDYVNPKFTEVTGYSSRDISGHGLELLQPPDHDDPFHHRLLDAVSRGENWTDEILTLSKDGRKVWQRASVASIRDQAGQVRNVVVLLEDVTRRRRHVQELQSSERKTRAISEAVLDAIVVLDDASRVTFWNPSAERILGWSEDEALGTDFRVLLSWPEDEPLQEARLTDADANPSGAVMERTLTRKDGSSFPCDFTVSSFILDERQYTVVTIRDITRRKQYEERLRSLAATDELTGLANRRALLQRAESELDRAKRYDRDFSLLMLDLDHFKRVNDTYGHDVGDKVLQSLASTGSNALRDADLLGRLGGEEFAAVLPETSAIQAKEVAERLREAVALARVPEASAPDGTIGVTISIGVAEYRSGRDTVDEILKAADKALYQAKNSGRNRTEIG